jgi:putative membrane protein insertion efficiency factor
MSDYLQPPQNKRTRAAPWAVRPLLWMISGYRRWISPYKPPMCRFTPTCSEYAQEAFANHGLLRGGWLASKRVCRCHPFGGHGWDPVPPRNPPPP